MIVCDVGRLEYDGKLTLVGVYTTDLGIPANSTVAPTIAFFVAVEGDLSEQPAFIEFEICLPGQPPIRLPRIEIPAGEKPPEGRTRWIVRTMHSLVNAPLQPGHITGKVICDDREVPISGPWIVVAENPAPAPNSTVQEALPPKPQG
jgi:hypothetical protein